MRELADVATSRTVSNPVVTQYRSPRSWLWRQWKGTIVRAVLPKEVVFNTAMASILAWLVVYVPGTSWLTRLKGVNAVWLLASSLVTFTISFFLSTSYAVWRQVYSLSRRVQGRLNDLGALCAASAARNADGTYTERSQVLLSTVARYVRLFSILLYASLSSRFSPLKTPKGLAVLVDTLALTEEERSMLLESSLMHNAVLGWLWAVVETGLRDGTLGAGGVPDADADAGAGADAGEGEGEGAAAGAAAARGVAPPVALQLTFEQKLLELRATYASISDELSGRMPLAYTQLVQILVDILVVVSPFALLSAVTPVQAVMGTGMLTLFYTGVLNLAKVSSLSLTLIL